MKKLLIKVLCGIIISAAILSLCITAFGESFNYPLTILHSEGCAVITQTTQGEESNQVAESVEEILVTEEEHYVIVQGKRCNDTLRTLTQVEKFPPEVEQELIFNEEGPSYAAEPETSAAPATTAPVVQPEQVIEPVIETQPIIETQPETVPETIPETVPETVLETQPAPPQTEAPPQVSPLYSVNGAIMSEDLQTFLYSRLTERGISWFMPYALANAYQESRFNIYAENPNGLDKGLFQYRITYYPGANIFDPYEQIVIYCDQMANRLHSGCSVEDAISRHMMSDYGPYNASYVQLIMSWFAATARIR